MAKPKSSAETMRKVRERKRCGTVILQGIEVKRIGVELLIAKGWLDADAEPDALQVRAALNKMVNKVLTEPEPEIKFWPRPLQRAIQAVKMISFGLF